MDKINIHEARKKQIEKIKKISNLDTECQMSHEEYREPLSITVFREIDIILSWGGPSDGFKLRFNDNDELIGGVYYRTNWGEYSESSLNDKEVDLVFEFYLYGDISHLESKSGN